MEFGTGIALLVDPARVVSLLLGAESSGAVTPVARCFGIGLLALGVACWPRHHPVASDSPAFRAMLVYNAGIALYLGWLGAGAHVGGVLLWPAVALHAAVAFLLVRAARGARTLS